MALPIKETPVLKGRDANRFVRNMCRADSTPVPKEDYERARRTYRQMKEKGKIGG